MSKNRNNENTAVVETEEIEVVAPETELENMVHDEDLANEVLGVDEEGNPVEEAQEELTAALIVRHLVGKIETKSITPYAVHTVINGALEVLGSEKRIRPQMMYNYDRNGLIVKGKKGVKAYSHDEVIAYATKYVEKHTK